MNRVFRLVWSECQKRWVIASEHAKGKTKSGVSSALRKGALLSLACVLNTAVVQPVLAATESVGSGVMVTGEIVSSGTQTIQSGGISNSGVVVTSGIQYIINGGMANGTSLTGGTQYISGAGVASSTTISAGGTQSIQSGGVANDTTITGGIQNIQSGGVASGTTLTGGTQYISDAGVASSTTISAGGNQSIQSGGVANDTTITGGIQNIQNGGVASGTTLTGGTQYISDAGVAISTTISAGGTQSIQSGGVAKGTTISLEGTQNIQSGGVASSTTLTGGTQYISGAGVASSTTIRAGGNQYVSNGGVTSATTISSGGTQSISGGGSAVGTVISDGAQIISSGGVASGTIIRSTTSTGTQYISSGGVANGTIISSGGTQSISSGGVANGTTISSGGAQNILGGVANDTTINWGGTQYVLSGGTANDTMIVYGGTQSILGGVVTGAIISAGSTQNVLSGVVNGTIVSSGAMQYVLSSGVANDTTVSSGGTQRIFGGVAVASGTIVSSSGALNVLAGGTAIGVDQQIGGALITGTDATVSGNNRLGGFSVDSGTHAASNVVLESGGELDVLSNGVATDTTVSDMGSLVVTRGGVLLGTTRINGLGQIAGDAINNGNLIFNQSNDGVFSGGLSGSGTLTKDGSNQLTLTGPLSYTGNTYVNAGTLALDGTRLTGTVVGQSGSFLRLQNGASLTGMIDPLNVTLEAGTNWEMIADSQIDTLTNAGSIDFQASAGAFATKTLTVNNLVGDNGVITLNTMLGNGPSLIDKIVIDGGAATGSTRLAIRNVGGLGGQTSGNGIEVVEAMHGGTTADTAFKLNGRVLAGQYEYSLWRDAASQDWFLTTDQVNNATGGGSGNQSRPNYRAETSLDTASPSMALDYGNALIGTLSEHGGAFASGTLDQGQHVWMHTLAQHTTHDGGSDGIFGNGPAYNSTITGLQLGTDLYQHNDTDGKDRAGLYAAIGQNKGSVDHFDGSKAGSNRLTAYSMGAYWSHIAPTGLYLDGVLQATWNKVEADSVNGIDLKTDGFGRAASLEAGFPFDVGHAVVIEPQAQVIYQHIGMANSHDVLADVSFGSVDSLQARVGVRAAKTWTKAEQTPITAWVRPSIVQELKDNASTRFSTPNQGDVDFNSDQRGTLLKLDTGVEGALTTNVSLNTKMGYDWGASSNTAGSGYSAQVCLSVKF
ncbi:MAG: autotransporter outer rane beta-barrel protein [Pseudomonas sp.]|nr:autotransporter outer rane beta-barrel protein [Pseudomonas sp.]